MGTLEGFPSPPAMSSARRSRATLHASLAGPGARAQPVVDLGRLRLHRALCVALPSLLGERARPGAITVGLPERPRERETGLRPPRPVHLLRLADLERALQRSQRAARLVLRQVRDADAGERVGEVAILEAELALPDHPRPLERLPRL